MCNPMWHVSSRSGVATLRTAIHLNFEVADEQEESLKKYDVTLIFPNKSSPLLSVTYLLTFLPLPSLPYPL